MDDLAAKITQLEAMRPMFGDAWVDARIAELRAEADAPAAHQHMAAEDGGQIAAATQHAAGGARGKASVDQSMHASGGSRISGAAQVTGDYARITINPEPVDHEAEACERALIDYLSMLQSECSSLQLTRIDESESRYRRPMRLEQVYIGLHTTSQVEEAADGAADAPSRSLKTVASRVVQRVRRERAEVQARPLTALEAVTRGTPPRLMLLGAPGSGKSTFVNHLVLCLAGAALAERGLPGIPAAAEWLSRLHGWGFGALLPLRIILHEFAAFPLLAQAGRGSLNLLLDFLQETLGAHAEALEPIHAELTGGRAILLFDGLDEVVGDAVLARVAESIADAARTYARCPIVVTCRVLDYQANPLRQLRGFESETLAPLTDEQIEQFVGAWYDELAASGREMLGNAGALRQAVASRSELRDLARLPLLLTMMAVVHAGKGTLPDARALLYYECVDLLLLRWRQEPGQPDALERLNLPQFRASDLLALMARLGFAAHEAAARESDQADRPANLSREQVQRLLEETLAPYSAGDPIRRDTLASQLLHAIALRNGLLLK
jgi:predicted NACHT family NTPase